MTFKKSLCATAVGLALASGSAFATNGYFAHGYGTKNKAMAGAGVALPQDAMTAATNPAGMVEVGNRMDFGAGLFMPFRAYNASTPTGGMLNAMPTGGADADSGRNIFLVPHFAYNSMLDDTSSVGVAVYGNGGMNTKYDNAFGMGTTGVDLMQLFIAPTYARQMTDKVSVGVSAILAAQMFKAYGLEAFNGYSSTSDTGTGSGYDTSYGFGGKIGVLADLSDSVSVGASYQSKIYMSKFDQYAGLFAEQGDFDIPANFTVGVAFKPNSKTVVTADVQHIMYDDVASISNPISNLFSGPSGALGADNGAGFGWDDITVYKLGVQYAYSSDLTVRAGFSHTEAPFAASELMFNILAPAVVENHITAGFTKQMGKDAELSVSAMYAPEGSVSGNPFGTQDIEVKMDQYELEVSYGMKW